MSIEISDVDTTQNSPDTTHNSIGSRRVMIAGEQEQLDTPADGSATPGTDIDPVTRKKTRRLTWSLPEDVDASNGDDTSIEEHSY
jgi:hypothetical protein